MISLVKYAYVHEAKSRLQFDWHSESAWQSITHWTNTSLHFAPQRSLWPWEGFHFKCKNNWSPLSNSNPDLVSRMDTRYWMQLKPVTVLKWVSVTSFAVAWILLVNSRLLYVSGDWAQFFLFISIRVCLQFLRKVLRFWEFCSEPKIWFLRNYKQIFMLKL